MSMNKEYYPNYDVLLTTEAWGVTRGIIRLWHLELWFEYFIDDMGNPK